MGSYYSDYHTAEDNIHTDITICNTEELQQKYRLGRVSNSVLEGVGFHWMLVGWLFWA